MPNRREQSDPPTPDDLVRAVAAAGVRDERILQAMRDVPRAGFVPPEFASRAYRDAPVPIPHGQVTTQPSLIAQMIAALNLTGDEQVLEIGTGYGYQTALLARLARFVWSVERWPDLAETARANLARQGVTNVEVVAGDGTLGLPDHAPFDAIVVAAAFPEVPPPLVAQLTVGGRLVQPIGPGGAEEVVLFEKDARGLQRRGVVTLAYFVRLYGEHGFAAEGDGSTTNRSPSR
jgi:protein-L-isoaspartate(D-aspartate) O-methyltransferase